MLFTASRTLLNLIAACIKNHNTANKYPISIKTKNALSIAKATNVNNIIEKAKNSNRQGGGQAIVDDIYNRKWTDPFIEEMSRSAKLWIERWQDNKKE